MKMKRMVLASVILLMIIAVGFILWWRLTARTFDTVNQELEYVISEFVENDNAVGNCVLSVMKGDGSFSWSGAAGIARRDGQVPMTTETPIYLASITKLYTATAVMRLYEKGALSLDDPMSKYLPEELIHGIHVYEGKDYSHTITIQELLSHTSGIADYYSETPKGGKSFFESFLEEPERSWTVDETIARARTDLDAHFQPGTDASYSDTNFQLLGKVIEAVTDKPLHLVYEELFFRPLGLKHTWLASRSEPQVPLPAAPADIYYKDMIITNIRSNGSYWADGGLVSTAEEGIMFLKALNEGRIVREDTLKLMHNWHKLEFPLQYGYGTMRFKLPGFMTAFIKVPPLWGHSGSTGSFLYYSEDLNLYMAGSLNRVGANSTPFRLMMRVMQAIHSKKEV